MRVRLPLLAFSLVLLSSLPALGADDMDFAPVSVEGDKESAGELEEALARLQEARLAPRQSHPPSHRRPQRGRGHAGGAEGRIHPRQDAVSARPLPGVGELLRPRRPGGPEHRYFKATCKWLYYLSRKLSGDPGLLEKICQVQGRRLPDRVPQRDGLSPRPVPLQEGRNGAGAPGLTQVTPGQPLLPQGQVPPGHCLCPPRAAEARRRGLQGSAAARRAATTPAKTSSTSTSWPSSAWPGFSTAPVSSDQAVKYYDQVPARQRPLARRPLRGELDLLPPEQSREGARQPAHAELALLR
jgi:hypothetical protein